MIGPHPHPPGRDNRGCSSEPSVVFTGLAYRLLRDEGNHEGRDGTALPLGSRPGAWNPHVSRQPPTQALVSYLLDHLCGLQISPVENLLVVVHPDLSQAHLIACDNTGALGEGVGTLGTEHVADHRAGDDLQLAPTLPHLTQRR